MHEILALPFFPMETNPLPNAEYNQGDRKSRSENGLNQVKSLNPGSGPSGPRCPQRGHRAPGHLSRGGVGRHGREGTPVYTHHFSPAAGSRGRAWHRHHRRTLVLFPRLPHWRDREILRLKKANPPISHPVCTHSFRPVLGSKRPREQFFQTCKLDS